MLGFFSRRLLVRLFVAGLVLALAGVGAFYIYAGSYGFNVVFRRGGSIWTTVKPDDFRISPSMRLALRPDAPVGEAGSFTWQEVVPGFDVAEMSVLVGGVEVDRILLSRIDPKNFRIEFHNVPSGRNDLVGWMRNLNAAFVINGGYFSRHGLPDTPFLAKGALSGPAGYKATHGAFVVSDSFVGIRDLQNEDWRKTFERAEYGMVSYPLLYGPNVPRSKSDLRWLANRSFVGHDRAGRLIFGTTKDAFFSLERLARFLGSAPLDLELALNLDGGPVACQGISLNGFARDFCGDWETATSGDAIQLLGRVFGQARWGLPIVIAAFPK